MNKTLFIGLTSGLGLFFAMHLIPRAMGTRYFAAALLAPVAIFTMLYVFGGAHLPADARLARGFAYGCGIAVAGGGLGLWRNRKR